jgi:hypothetical protein
MNLANVVYTVIGTSEGKDRGNGAVDEGIFEVRRGKIGRKEKKNTSNVPTQIIQNETWIIYFFGICLLLFEVNEKFKATTRGFRE